MRLKTTLLTVLSVLCLGVGPLTLRSAYAQAPGGPPPLPVDTAVRIGKLPNGLTYFIRHNQEPKGRAEFYIAQKVGSMQEEDSQQGLAHFLEHIAFNGTKHFPGKGIINYLESIGASFGGNINAYTSFDQTVYTLMKIPVSRPTIVDSCLLILHDWSNSIALEDKEIDAERGVIEEEWRSRDSGNGRNLERLLTLSFPNNKYGSRLPIGKMEIVRSFPYQVLRDYYKKWYRPDLQGIIVVGDVDVDRTEAQLKQIFSDIPAPVNPAERVYYQVEDNEQPIVGIIVDKEATNNILSLSLKSDVMPDALRASIMGPVEEYSNAILTSVINERFGDIVKKPNAPFLGASVSTGRFLVAKTKDATRFSALFKEGQWEPALNALVAEVLRIKQYGITPAEYERAKQDYLVSLKNAYNERDKQNSADLAEQCVEYFLNGGTLLDVATQYQLMQGLIPQLQLAELNSALKAIDLDKNVVLAISGVDKPEANLPSVDLLTQKYRQACAQQVEAPKNEVSNQKLLDKLPAKGKIVKETKNAHFGTTVWTLSNGAKVYVKKTDYKEDEISLTAEREGGYYNLPRLSPLDIKVLNQVADLGGLGAFDASALGKVLAGRIASISASVSPVADAISGGTTKEDLETMMQLLYLSFTARRADQEAFQAWQEQTISALQTAKAHPLSFLSDSLARYFFPKNPERYPLTEQEVKQVDYPRLLQLFSSRFANARGFNFYFVGNIDEATLRPLVEQYIASLPAQKTYTDKAYYTRLPLSRSGLNHKEYTAPMATPTGIVVDGLSTAGVYTQKEILTAAILEGILDQLYVKTIREDEGGTYSVGVNATVNRYPVVQRELSIQFQTDPTKTDKLNALVFQGLEAIAKDGPSAEYFDKTVANLKKSHSERLRENTYWLGQLSRYFGYGLDFVTNYVSTLESVKPQDVQRLVQDLVNSKDRTTIIFRSTEQPKP